MASLPLLSLADSEASRALHDYEDEYAYDDQFGEALDVSPVKKARREEMDYSDP